MNGKYKKHIVVQSLTFVPFWDTLLVETLVRFSVFRQKRSALQKINKSSKRWPLRIDLELYGHQKESEKWSFMYLVLFYSDHDRFS